MATVKELDLGVGDAAVVAFAEKVTKAGRVSGVPLDARGAVVTVSAIRIKEISKTEVAFDIYSTYTEDNTSRFIPGTRQKVAVHYPGFLKGRGYGDAVLEEQLEGVHIEIIRNKEFEDRRPLVRKIPALRPDEV